MNTNILANLPAVGKPPHAICVDGEQFVLSRVCPVCGAKGTCYESRHNAYYCDPPVIVLCAHSASSTVGVYRRKKSLWRWDVFWRDEWLFWKANATGEERGLVGGECDE
jgi:hypothetical protein